MTSVIAALLPVFAIIAAGVGLRVLKFMPEDGWRAVERITYFILFPCFLFSAIAFADFSNEPLGNLSMLLAGSMMAMAAITYAVQATLGLGGPAFTSLFQGAVRWNSYVALGAISAVMGHAGLALAAVAVAIMVPLANLLCILVLVRHAGEGNTRLAVIAMQMLRNPLILGCAAGVIVQALAIPVAPAIVETIGMLGKAALPLGLLAVGASLDLGHARTNLAAISAASLLKLAGMPLLVAAGAWALDLSTAARTAALLCAAVPGASSSFILARQMGGDAPLMAGITTVQTVAALITMPLMLWVLA